MAPDSASWYVLIAEQQTGPLTRVELGVELASGAISPESLVWKEGMINWVPGVKVPELEALFKNPPRSPRASGARPPPPPRKQDKGMGLSDFDTSHFRLADLQPDDGKAARQMEFDTGHFRLADLKAEDGGTTRQMEFDTSHFRLADLKGGQGTRAQVPKRIVPKEMESPAFPQSPNNPGKAGARTVLKQASTAAARPMAAAPVAVRQSPAAAPKPRTTPVVSDFDPNATAVDFRTLGELVHLQHVEQSLFESELVPGKAPVIEEPDADARAGALSAPAAEEPAGATGSRPDLAAKLKAKARATPPLPSGKSRLPTAVAIAGALAVAVALVWYLFAN